MCDQTEQKLDNARAMAEAEKARAEADKARAEADKVRTDTDKSKAEPDGNIEEIKAPVEMFKALATFGFLAALLCLGAPLTLLLFPAQVIGSLWFIIMIGPIVGLLVVVFVLVFCCILSGKLRSSSK